MSPRIPVFRAAQLLVAFSGGLFAVPALRLTNTAAVISPDVPGSETATLEAYNAGDGSLSVKVSVPQSASWLVATPGPPGGCTATNVASICVPIRFAVNRTLPAQTSSADVLVYSPGAVDSPQVIAVVAHSGTSVYATAVDAVLGPGAARDIRIDFPATSFFCPPGCPTLIPTTRDGGTWLGLAVTGMGTLQFSHQYWIHLSPPGGIGPGAYSGEVATITNNSGAPPVAPIPVTMHVDPQQLAIPSPASIRVTLPQGGPALGYPFVPPISLDPAGRIMVKAATAAGPGIQAAATNGLAMVTVDPGTLGAGDHLGSVALACDAADCPVSVPITLRIVAPGPPVIESLTKNTDPRTLVSPGEVAVLRGVQLSSRAPEVAPGVPLPITLGGVQVLVNGVPAPLYYTSSVQIAFQVPSGAQTTASLVLVRDGQPAREALLYSATISPGLVAITDAAYHPLDGNHPVRAGASIILWSVGLGQTKPSVADGMAAPESPLATAVTLPLVRFGTSTSATPLFAGLTPGYAGLFQVNVTVPPETPKGNLSVKLVYSDGNSSNALPIAIE